MHLNFSLRQPLLLALLSTSLLVSCKKTTDDVTPAGTLQEAGSGADAGVKNWILSNMRAYYLWTDKIPANPDTTLAPDKLFYSILYDYGNTANINRDRNSVIYAQAADLKASLAGQSKTTGMDYRFYYRDASNTGAGVIASVISVLPGSPAALAGVKRGDIITKVNGQSITVTNYSTILTSSDTYVLGFSTYANGTYTETNVTKQVTAIAFQQDPVLLDSVYSIKGKTIGYVLYNQFIPGVADASGSFNTVFDQKLDNIFGKFKQAGVNELVLDLRYNRGGYVTSSANLASLIGKNVDASKVYYSQQWNSLVTSAYNQKYGANWNTQNFLNKATNIGGNLSRVYILTTSSTASASELIINGLRPFMTVNTIGTTTYGKNVGSITISDKTGKIAWGMQPITFKSANSQGYSDYAAGFTPTVTVQEPSVNLKPFGDISEPLLNEAIFQITGSRTARKAASDEPILTTLGSSIDGKAGGGNMFLDPNDPKFRTY